MMQTPFEPDDRKRELLSALMDGQASPAEMDSACAQWRDDVDARASWHAFHLIGDAMRSEELATPAGRDAAFLKALRARLATEPVLLAPAPRPRISVWRRLAAPAAMAAGFAAVSSAVIVLRATPADTARTTLASGAGRSDSGRPVQAASFIRDSHIDSYFEAHRQQSIRRAGLSDGAVMRGTDAVVIESR